MAKRVIHELIDDMNGQPADESVTFGLDGVQYEIDLTTKNAVKLRSALAPFVAAATKVGRGARRAARGTGGAAARPHRSATQSGHPGMGRWQRHPGLRPWPHQAGDRRPLQGGGPPLACEIPGNQPARWQLPTPRYGFEYACHVRRIPAVLRHIGRFDARRRGVSAPPPSSGWPPNRARTAIRRSPADLQTPPTPQTTYVYADDGKTLITMFYDQNRHDVRSTDRPGMQQAIVAAEDTRFYQRGASTSRASSRHGGQRPGAAQRTQGASTLTMQYVRNVLKNDPSLTPQQRVDATADTLGRKIQEIRYATAWRRSSSKSEILDRYLNIAYFGDGAYGIASASRTTSASSRTS